ncbi:DUF4097 family beta strand repeat-containing protein [Ectobacillus funiculus]|uniref:DUF4097 family beta strand repeat-containing protein n=1 Tax=Ectobacillus funiculus TaxID=137993 RepID=UPI00101D68F4|nr:DUF4097 family beta strand repeat-containing protein [Ectobacillus funiculus]
MKMETSSGDIAAKDNEAKIIDLFSSSGDITSYNQVLEDTKMETSSGDIDVKLTKAPASLVVDYKGGSGDGTANIDGMNFSEKSEDRIVGQTGDGNFKLTARTSSGDFKIKD